MFFSPPLDLFFSPAHPPPHTPPPRLFIFLHPHSFFPSTVHHRLPSLFTVPLTSSPSVNSSFSISSSLLFLFPSPAPTSGLTQSLCHLFFLFHLPIFSHSSIPSGVSSSLSPWCLSSADTAGSPEFLSVLIDLLSTTLFVSCREKTTFFFFSFFRSEAFC